MQGKDRKLLNIELGRVSAEEYRRLPDSGLVVVLDNVRSAHNVGSVFRTADSFRIDRIFLCGICPVPPSAEIHKSALGAEESVVWEHCEDTMKVVERLRDEGYTVVSVEQTVNSVKLDEFHPYGDDVSGSVDKCHVEDIDGYHAEDKEDTESLKSPTTRKYALVFGNEVDGVSQEVVDASDFSLEIPQFGMKHSLNVSVSAGVVLWHFKLSAIRAGIVSDNFTGREKQ